MIVSEELPYPADFNFAQRCLEGDVRAMGQLRTKYRKPIEGFLMKAGGSESEVSEIVDQLWTDCLVERPGNRPRLATYSGKAKLSSWLSAIAMNQLLRVKQKRARDKTETLVDNGEGQGMQPPEESAEDAEPPLIKVLREAVEAGFQECPAEDFVLLQLNHMDGLHLEELATMFSCSKSKIDRDVKRAQKRVREATLNYVRKVDPWLDLKWRDFMALCRVASPACFGTEETV